MASDLDRLRLLYDLNRRLSTFTDLDELVRYVTRCARELLRADGCALLLFDARRNELYFPVASQREGRAATPERLAEIRFPADRGVAGSVFGNDHLAFYVSHETAARNGGRPMTELGLRYRWLY